MARSPGAKARARGRGPGPGVWGGKPKVRAGSWGPGAKARGLEARSPEPGARSPRLGPGPGALRPRPIPWKAFKRRRASPHVQGKPGLCKRTCRQKRKRKRKKTKKAGVSTPKNRLKMSL